MNNAGEVSAPAGLAARASAFSPFAPNMTATKSHTPSGSVHPGDTLTYTVVITNAGTTDATGVNFSDTIDPNTTLVGGSLIASPIAVNDSYNTIGNVNISVPVGQGVIANDLNPNGSGTLTVTQVNSTPVPGGGSASAGTTNGSVTMSSDGSFSYTPNVAFRGPSDSFTYILGNGTGKTDTATVTITVNGLIWFVNVAAAPGGDGRLGSPFNCLVGPGCFDAVAADIGNDNIFVYSGAYVGGLTLLSGQKLIGQGAGDTLLSITGLTAPSGTNMLPSTGGTPPTIAATGTNITLGSGNTIRGVTLNGTAPAAVDLAGTGFGTATIAETALGGIGQALNLSSGTLSGPVSSTAAFTSISSTNSNTTGISMTGVGGNMSSGSTIVTNPTGIGISINTSSAAFNFSTTSSTGSGGTGVSLTANTGTITFGALTITPDANQRGLLATDNSNTITIPSGAITASGGIAVEITRSSSTTPLAISLTSVSANGGNNGIILTNTSGGFAITGDGTNAQNSSGGTIQNMTTGADGAVAGRGISVSNVSNLSLRQMNMHDFSNFAIFGSNVTGFTFDYSVISGVSGSVVSAADEAAIRFDGLFGTASISHSDVSGGFEYVIKILNSSGTLNRLTMNSTTIGGNHDAASGNGADAFQLVAQNSATANVTVSNSTFTSAGANLFNAVARNQSNMDVVFCTNMVSNNHANQAGASSNVLVFSTSTGNVTYAISNNTVLADTVSAIANTSNGIAVAKGVPDTGTGGSMIGTVTNNTVGQSGVVGSGSAFTGIFASALGTGTHTTAITSNTIYHYNEEGILLKADDPAGGGTSVLNATVTGNQTLEPDSSAFAGLWVLAGSGSGTENQVINVVIGNQATAALQNDFTNGDPNDFSDVEIQSFGSNTVINLSKAGSASGTVEGVIQDDNVGTPAVDSFGTINLVNTTPTTPPAIASCMAASASAPPAQSLIQSAGPISDQASPVDDRDADLRTTRGEGPYDENIQKLDQSELNWMVQAAIGRWGETGISAEDLARLQAVTFEIADLPNSVLASISGTRVKIDETAAGYGWFFDQSPKEDSEFNVPVPGKEFHTTEYSPAHSKMDLLTVVMRELGAVYLQGKNRVPKQLRPLMEKTLSPAVRRMPVFRFNGATSPGTSGEGVRNDKTANARAYPKADPDVSPATLRFAVFHPSADLMPGSYGRRAKLMSYSASARRVAAFRPAPFSGETVTLNVGTIPAGESVTIMFQVTIDNPLPAGVCAVTNVGHVTGSNFSPVDTNADAASIVTPVVIGSCPSNIMTNTAPGVCSAVVTYATPTATGCPVPSVSCNPPSGFAFPKGITTVTCTATNGNPPNATCTFTVTVNDNQPPTIGACPANITTDEDPPGSGSATVTYATPGSTDNCPGQTVNCNPPSGSSFPVGTTTVTCTAMDTSGNTASCQFTVTVNSVGLTALSPAMVWIGLKNSDDVGTKFDLLAEVLKNGSVVGSGQLNDVPGGSSAFNNAVLRSITLGLGSSVGIGAGDTLSFRLSARIAATSGHTHGTARLWYNGAAIDTGPSRDAGSRFDATIAGSTSNYFLRSPGFTLNTAAGSSRVSVDVTVSNSGGNPFVPFGTWSKTF
ncbi:MAG TPA: HYR domain-containing protein [Blastocatellia bacterium]|nr:HYR domain-containing protein [Blastocatellia bacterium]